MTMDFGIDAMSGFRVTNLHADRPGTDVFDIYEVLHHGAIGCQWTDIHLGRKTGFTKCRSVERSGIACIVRSGSAGLRKGLFSGSIKCRGGRIRLRKSGCAGDQEQEERRNGKACGK